MEPSCSGTSNNEFAITRQELYIMLSQSGFQDLDSQFNILKEKLITKTGNIGNSRELNAKLATFKGQLKLRWAKACRKKERFLNDNKSWLQTSISFSRPQSLRGRPELEFEKCSERTKRQKTEKLRNLASASELSYATQMAFRAHGQTEASKFLRDLSLNPECASTRSKSLQKNKTPLPSSGDEALAVLVDAKLSRHQYQVIRSSAPERFPSYKCVQAVKKLCYPPKNCIRITETCAQVTLQGLLDHTVKRLLPILELNHMEFDDLKKLCLISKWGFDGSSGHSSYKQAFYQGEGSDSSVVITCIVPIKLKCEEKCIWQNPRPAATRFCRPLKINYVRESAELSREEKASVDEEIQNLQPTSVAFKNGSLNVKHSLIFAMVDGKICNALTDTTSTQRCYICRATSKDFNDIDNMVGRTINTDHLQFGLSILHGWIRMFECLLHLSYKLPIQKWQARGDVDKKTVSENKSRIQKKFREQCGLIVDQPKPGFGNTNDGNTARKFFQNPEVSSEITGLDIELIKKMHTIMIVVSSGLEINVEKFREYALETARYFVLKYPWYNMPPTLHKYFIHGPEIISSALLPIGQLSEEAQEARNKDFKRFRESFSRKCSRENTNEDILNQFLISSDPIINSKRLIPKKKLAKIPQEALNLLKQNENMETSSAGNSKHINDYNDDDDDDYDYEDDTDTLVDESEEEIFVHRHDISNDDKEGDKYQDERM